MLFPNPLHKLLIVHSRDSTPKSTVIANVPEEDIAIDVASDWAQTDLGKVVEGAMGMVNRATSAISGSQLKSQLTSAQQWNGTNPPSIAFTLEFNADTSSVNDVMQPIANIISMCVPEVINNIRVAVPGPTPADAALAFVNKVSSNTGTSSMKLEGDRIQLFVGKWLYWDNVVITNLGLKFGTKLGPEGIPLRATATVTMKPFMTPYRQDIFKALRISPSLIPNAF